MKSITQGKSLSMNMKKMMTIFISIVVSLGCISQVRADLFGPKRTPAEEKQRKAEIEKLKKDLKVVKQERDKWKADGDYGKSAANKLKLFFDDFKKTFEGVARGGVRKQVDGLKPGNVEKNGPSILAGIDRMQEKLNKDIPLPSKPAKTDALIKLYNKLRNKETGIRRPASDMTKAYKTLVQLLININTMTAQLDKDQKTLETEAL